MSKAADLMNLGVAWPLAQSLGLTSASITAAGSSSSDATAANAQNTFLIVTATGTDGIRLSSSTPLLVPIIVANPSGSNGKVYPHTGGAVNGGSTDAGETIASTTVQIWVRYSSTAWAAVLGA